MMETETIDRLFLELSQFTRAETAKERRLRELLTRAAEILTAMDDEEVCMTDHHGDCQEHYGSIEVAPDVWACAQHLSRMLRVEIQGEADGPV